MKTIKVSDETHKRLVVIRSEIEGRKGQIISMDKVIKAVLDDREAK